MIVEWQSRLDGQRGRDADVLTKAPLRGWLYVEGSRKPNEVDD